MVQMPDDYETKDDDNIEEELLSTVHNNLSWARQHGLETEVVVSALLNLSNDKKKCIEAIDDALADWVVCSLINL